MSIPPLLNGPQPPYNNPPIAPQYYQPSRFIISALSIGTTTTVTTSVSNNYVVGQKCRLLIPNGYGCTQLNEQTGIVIDIPADNQVIINLNSQYANIFINAGLLQKPQIVAIGDVNTGAINNHGRFYTKTFIPGSFINISPC